MFIINTCLATLVLMTCIMFVPIQFGINMNTNQFSNTHPFYVHSINTNHIIVFISFVTKYHTIGYSHV